jgi:hypothetical protein
VNNIGFSIVVISVKHPAMRILFFAVVILYSLFATAQFPYNPFPFKQADFKKIKDLGYTKLFVYIINGEERSLGTEVEYGNQGLIAAIYEKGTNDNGDTVNKEETYFTFDGKGRMTKKEFKNDDYGESITVFTYDAAGRLIRKQTATIDPPTYKYAYDPKGRLAEVKVTQKMGEVDKEGESTGKTFDKPSNRYVYKYDAKGRMAEEWNFMYENKTQKPDYKTTWTYNDKNQVVKIRRINSEGTEMNHETYEYNADGLISAGTFNNGDEDVKYVYEYCKGCKQSWMK